MELNLSDLSFTLNNNSKNSKIEKQLFKLNSKNGNQSNDDSLSSEINILKIINEKDYNEKMKKALNIKKRAVCLFSENEFSNSLNLFLEVI